MSAVDLDAEEMLLGAVLLSPAVVEKAKAVGLAPTHFYRETHGRIFRVACELYEREGDLDVVTLADELQRRGDLEEIGGIPKLSELAAIAPATSNAGRHAVIIARAARERAVENAITVWTTRHSPETQTQLRQALDDLQRYSVNGAAAASTATGVTHAELMALELPPATELIDGIVEAGTPGTVAGLPETYKSWVALQATLRVAGGGVLLGRKVRISGPVGYWWQDDSRENEVRRIQSYARRHNDSGELAVRWHLNEALVLPDGLAGLRAEIEREQQVLVVLDSLYNFLPKLKLKEEDVGLVIAQVKADVCDPTGCTVLIVDHAPWPTEGNQGQRRAYGSVFKAAAIRWGIYLEKSGDTLFVEARGNNIAGLDRTPAIWDPDRLELRLVEPPTQTDDLGDRIDEFLAKNPGATTKVIVAAVPGNDKHIKDRLEGDERWSTVPPVLFGKPKNAKCWARLVDVPGLLEETR